MLSAFGSCGHYAVTFSGGTINYTVFGVPQTGHFNTTGQANETYQGFVNIVTGDSGTVSGPITATFTWVPDTQGEPTPSSVLILESANAEWQSDPGAGFVDDGYGDAPTTGFNFDHSLETDTSYRFNWTRIDNPASMFDVPIGASAYAQVAVPFNGSWNAYISLTFTVHPISISLTGPTGGDGNGNFLLGQQAQFTAKSGEAYVSGYLAGAAWTLSGCSPFKAFSYTMPVTSPPVRSTGQVTQLGTADYGNETLTACFATPGTVSALRMISEHGTSSGTWSANYQFPFTEAATVLSPTVNAYSYIYDGTWTIVQAPDSNSPGFVRITDASGGTGSTSGEAFQTSVSLPQNWQGSTTGSKWNVVQLISFGSGSSATTRTFNGVTQTFYAFDGTYNNGVPANTYTLGLDDTLPYEPPIPSSGNSWPDGYWPVDGVTLGAWNDTPGFPLDQGMTDEWIRMTFTDYVMYLAPGTGSQFVPIQSVQWHWFFHIVLANGQWASGPQLVAHQVWHNAPITNPGFGQWLNLVFPSTYINGQATSLLGWH